MSDEQKKNALIERAQRLFKEYYINCFWHMKPDLKVTEEMLPSIIKGLRNHGGRDAFRAAALFEKESE